MPSPRAMYGGDGALKIVVRGEPAGGRRVARPNIAAERGVRARYSVSSGDVTWGSSLGTRRLSRGLRGGQAETEPSARTRSAPSARRIVADHAAAGPCREIR